MTKTTVILLFLLLFNCEEPQKTELPVNVKLMCVGGQFQVLSQSGFSIGIRPAALSVTDTVLFYRLGSVFPFLVTRIRDYHIERANNSFVNIDPRKPKRAFVITLKKLEQ